MNSRLLAVALAATSIALTGSPAMAKGGGDGGGGSTPAPPPPAEQAVPWALCPSYIPDGTAQLPDGSSLFANQITGVACLVARSQPSGALTLYELVTAPGWARDVKSAGGGSSNRIDVELNNPSTGEKHSFVIAPGKTVIR